MHKDQRPRAAVHSHAAALAELVEGPRVNIHPRYSRCMPHANGWTGTQDLSQSAGLDPHSWRLGADRVGGRDAGVT
jgi:hypothetical protein